MRSDGLIRALRDRGLAKDVEQGLNTAADAWDRRGERGDRGRWFKSSAAFALGASLAAAGVFLATRLGKELRDGGGDRLRQQAGERLGQTREFVGRAAQGAGNRLEQTLERLSARIEEVRPPNSSDVRAQISDLMQQAKSIEDEASSYGRGAARQAGETAEDASTRLGASESLGHEARRQEIGAEQAVDLDELIASIVPATEGDNGSVMSSGTDAQAAAAEMPKVSNGMKVVGFEGIDIGRIKKVREDGFVLGRPRADDLLVPLDSVYKVEGTLVYLRIEANQLHRQGWESVPPEGSETSGA